MFFPAAPGESYDRASCIRIPVRRPEPRECRHDVHAGRIEDLIGVFLGLGRGLHHAHLVAEPLDDRTRDEYRAFEGIFRLLAFKNSRTCSEKAVF